MKKIVYSLSAAALLLTTNTAQAQLQQGNILVGGQLANIRLGLGSTNLFSLDVTPKLGYFIRNNVAIGAEVPLGFTSTKNKATGNTETVFNYGVGVFGRYYFAPKEMDIDNLLNHGRFFLEANTGIAGTNGLGVGYNIGFGPGYAYFLTPNVALEGLVKFQGTYGTGNNSGLVFNLGFQIHLPTGKLKTEMQQIKAESQNAN